MKNEIRYIEQEGGTIKPLDTKKTWDELVVYAINHRTATTREIIYGYNKDGEPGWISINLPFAVIENKVVQSLFLYNEDNETPSEIFDIATNTFRK